METNVNWVGKLFKFIRENGTYLPRPYQTIGGGWTVDTWELNGVKAQLMDEGYTYAIKTDTVNAFQTYDRPAEYSLGTEANLIEIATKLGMEV